MFYPVLVGFFWWIFDELWIKICLSGITLAFTLLGSTAFLCTYCHSPTSNVFKSIYLSNTQLNVFKRWSKYLLTLLSCILTLFSVSPLRWSQWQIIDWYSDAIPILDQFLNGLTNHVTIWPFKNPTQGTPVFECMVFRYQL